jgi:hypothetical protein
VSTRDFTYPIAEANLGDLTGWEAWTRLTDTTWEVRSSKTHSWAQIPTTNLLGFRLYYTKQTHGGRVFSDMIHGWDFYAFDALQGGSRIRVVLADTEAELDAIASSPGFFKYVGGALLDASWIQCEAELRAPSRAVGW